VVTVAPFLLSGCSPPNEVGVRFDATDRPVVVNCGTWIDGVSVSDADTGRAVWAAHATPLRNGGLQTRGYISVGTLPGSLWTETAPLAVNPRPANLRFSVESFGHVVIDVSAASIQENRVYRSGARSESLSHFNEQTCSGIPLSTNQVRIGLVAVALATAAGVALSRIRRRKRDTAGA
jgi:hypothetical protein